MVSFNYRSPLQPVSLPYAKFNSGHLISTPQAAAAGFTYTEYEGYPYNLPSARIGYSFAVNQEQYATGKQVLNSAHPGDCTEHVYSRSICAPEKVTVCGNVL
ncbi:hypothetical protein INT43_005825 [Umbelopsis isabellina]|uniref:Uncharacterized protein n=1 Tax=Mortierella isabellina TaxID=91625 RepID=A0A8H7PIS5_MORIS|nr:hypothetical protein INT43_005825 [Umbelopsis isabellina]